MPRKLFAPERHDDIFLPHRTLSEEYIRWYDYWLKGIDTGIMDEPPIKLKVEGDGRFRYEYEWPIARTQWKKLYLHEGGKMNFDAPCSPEAPGVLDHEPPLEKPLFPRQVPGCSYLTKPLESDLEVTGPLTLYLSASIDKTDANIVVLLNDVLPDGRRQYITSGAIRMSHRLIGFDEGKPFAPLHDHTRSFPVTPGEVELQVIEMMIISRVFKANHRIEIVLKNFTPSEFNFITFIPAAEPIHYEFHSGKDRESYLLLPVIPQAPPDNWVR
ncbi:MAG: hypothetical protein IT308_13430 [Anaerolineaceae bacterium]|nr:hypothetical protein [Anaerolineaceae bacterium]